MATRDQIVKLLTDHPDMTYQGIGEMVGCRRQWVGQVAREAGLTRKYRLYRWDITIERILELYYCSSTDIARMLGCHPNTVTSRLRAAGISRSESYSRKQKLYWRGARGSSREVMPIEEDGRERPTDARERPIYIKI